MSQTNIEQLQDEFNDMFYEFLSAAEVSKPMEEELISKALELSQAIGLLP